MLSPKLSQMKFYHHRRHHQIKELSERYVKDTSDTERLIEDIKQLRTKMNVFRKGTTCCLKETATEIAEVFF